MGDSVALVSAPGAAGVSVNGGTAVTDWRGYAVVPYLTDYTRNSVGVDPSLTGKCRPHTDQPQCIPDQGAVVSKLCGPGELSDC
ncbi:fimbria/pilus outer membrane usher protein [Klebsiella variicola]|uniref:fimbria/pilus outer membrane usher protein n=1 Tax=Klebsiella variicola TaxID=244366 RepID=UPI0039F5F731